MVENLRLAISCEILGPFILVGSLLAAALFFLHFSVEVRDDRAVITRECIHRRPGGAVFYFCIAARERRPSTKPALRNLGPNH